MSALCKEKHWPRTSGFFQRMKNPFFNKKIVEWRNRFGGNSIDRQGNAKAIIREIRNGDFIIIAPDIDLGLKDSEFVPFFGIQTNTITTISRLAKITGADVCLMTTTLKADESGYLCEIGRPLENFPGEDTKSDTALLNQYFEDEIRLRPAEYYLVQLMDWAKPLKLPPERISYHVLEALDPASRIVEFAKDNDASLILIGASHKLPNKVTPWRTSMTKIVEEAPCSVHIVRT